MILAADMAAETAVVRDLLVILAADAVIAIAMARLRLAVVPAYIIAGAILGPYALGLVGVAEPTAAGQEAPRALNAIAQLAVILLLFGIGLDLQLDAIRTGLRQMITAGALSTLGTTALGWPIALAFGLTAPTALAVSLGLSTASTAVLLRVLTESRELRLARGRFALAVTVLQDLLVLGMLAALPALARWEQLPGKGGQAATLAEPVSWGGFAIRAVLSLLAVSIIIALGRLALPRLLREAARAGSLETMMLAAVASAVAAAVLSQLAGFSAAMGAFIAGFVLAGTPFRHQLAGQIGPLRDLFMAVFFTTLGMQIDPRAVLDAWWIILCGVFALIFLKASVTAFCGWAVGATPGVALAAGLFLAQAGEFSLVFLDAASAAGLLAPAELAATISIVVLSLILTPLLIDAGRYAAARVGHLPPAPWVHRPPLRDAAPGETFAPGEARPFVVIGGYGPVGWLIANELDRWGVRFSVVELNPATVRAQSARGRTIHFGDVGNPEVLQAAGIAHADALVLTMPNEDAVLRATSIARRLAPDIYITVRISVVAVRASMVRSGANHVTIDEIETASAMLAALTRRLRVGPHAPGQEPAPTTTEELT